MKNLLSAAGALSLGAASLVVSHTATAAEGGDKPWTASAALRGFYDDNIFTGNEANLDALGNVIDNKIGSWGFDVSPSLTYGRTIDNTSFDLGYTYLARWFDNRPGSSWDQNHNASVRLQHIFSPRSKVSVSDVFVAAQDPGQFAPLSGQVLRAEGNNINNSAAAEFGFALSEQFDATVSYRNNYFDYDNIAFQTALNRTEHLPTIDLSYLMTAATSLGVGYQYGIYDYELSPRDFDSHIVYVGIRHNFTQNFYGSLNVGAQVADYDLGGSETSPYLDGKLVYQYTAASDITFNVRHTLNATDVLLANNQETTLFRLAWGHAFTAKIKANVVGQFQNSDFNGGITSANETFWTMGTTLMYAFTPHVSFDVSYYHDNLNSDRAALGFERGYTRNRIFMGVRAAF